MDQIQHHERIFEVKFPAELREDIHSHMIHLMLEIITYKFSKAGKSGMDFFWMVQYPPQN